MARDEAYQYAEKFIAQSKNAENKKILSLSDMKLTEVPESIASLTPLQMLFLYNNQLTKLPESIASLTQLQLLNLSNNQLTQLPESIASLTQLKNLEVSSNQLTEVPDAIASLTQLQELNLSNNQLTEVPDAIASLTQLQMLDLRNNQLTEVPESIASLTQLQRLDLSNNRLTEVPESIASLTQLQILDLSNNQLRSLPKSIASLTPLPQLKLDSNPLNPDIAAAYEQGSRALFQYLRAKAEARVTLNEAKLIIIGEGEVGKSCLLGALRGDEWVEGRPTTHGIEIKPVAVTHSDTEIILNGWDFGGQRVYRPTHQLFFSAPAVYLVVWKPREGPQQGFVREWITLIKHRQPEAKVLVVATHGGPGQRQPDIDRQEILDRFGSDMVLGFFHVDSKPTNDKDCTGLADLKAAIASVAASLPEMGQTVPAKWQRAREILQTNNKAYLPYDDVIALCAQQGIDEEQAELFLRISNTLGHFIHYDYDPTLRDIVILKPDWLAKAISFVLDDQMTRQRNGLVEFDYLSQLWSNPPVADEEGYPPELHPIFLRLMDRFDLSYRVVFDPAKTSNTSLIAQLVPDIRPQEKLTANWGEQPESEDRQQVQICRIVDNRGQFAVAEGLFYQLIVRLHKYSLGRFNYEDSIHWKRGLMLENDYNGRALLEYIDTDVKITVRAAYPERFLSYLTEEIKSLVEYFWEGLDCNIMVPCLTPCGKNDPGNGLFEIEKLIESKKENRDEFPCPQCGKWQNIDRLLNNAPLAQPSAQILLTAKLTDVQDTLQVIRQELSAKDGRDRELYDELTKQQLATMSKVDMQFADMMQMLTDEAKDGPRLFSFKPIEPGFFDHPKWISAKFQLTLWCEHSRQPIPALNPNNKKQGVYELNLSREWFIKAAPYFKVMTGVLSLVLPVAGSATKLMLDDTTYQAIEEQLDLGQKSIESISKTSEVFALSNNDAPDFVQGGVIRGQGAILRELHALLKEKDPGFGGLVRVQNQRREFLWVHPDFVNEY
ncbi:COR domain-containing protein [Microcoleus sp. bin38.metabat.b11b12b14.051]|uniref:COR domain-containing protein n=1 Tax=Microcoleus sp. bin38.metabat.b11b12b14.051 TaxID=2742709 RepID=UPI0025F9B084|nr:COR domain-containing protein [Microcoleus sp. bin38.metabat.b11b12b14.051]